MFVPHQNHKLISHWKFSIRSFWALIRMLILTHIKPPPSPLALPAALWPMAFSYWPCAARQKGLLTLLTGTAKESVQDALPETLRTETDGDQEPSPFSGCQHGRPSPANNGESQWNGVRVKFGDINVGLSSSNQIHHIQCQEPISRRRRQDGHYSTFVGHFYGWFTKRQYMKVWVQTKRFTRVNKKRHNDHQNVQRRLPITQ